MWLTTATTELIEELAELPKKLNEPSYICAAFCP